MTPDSGDVLPALRPELSLHPGPARADGSPTWTLLDPLRHQFFQIGWIEHEILCRWSLGSVRRIVAALEADRNCPVGADHIRAMIGMMVRFQGENGLHQIDTTADADRLEQLARAGSPNVAMTLLHHAIMIRIPLLSPEPLLRQTAAWVEPLFGRTARRLALAVGTLGGLLTMRHWDAVQGALLDLAAPEHAAALILALLIAKTVHELGHAYAAHRCGCRVPTLGVAFIVGLPMLYTDTTDTWRLTDRRRRLGVAMAGMGAELGLGLVALLAWHLMADGPVRTAALLLATVSLIGTILVNINPLMRFDGYFLLCDWLDLPNLQTRASAMARWHLRKNLIGLCDLAPEAAAPTARRWLIAFGYASWLWRQAVVLGIAFAVYQWAFKLMGVALMALEIVWFIGRPIVSELRGWWTRRHELGWNRRTATTTGAVLVVGAVLALPWPSSLYVPALLVASRSLDLYPPGPCRIESVAITAGQTVEAGAPLLTCASPDLSFAHQQALGTVARLHWQLDHAVESAEAAGQADRLLVLREELAAARAAADGTRAELEQLDLRAPFPAQIAALADGLTQGRWLARNEWLAAIIDPTSLAIEAYIPEADLGHLAPGQRGTFVPESLDQPTRKATLANFEAATLGVLARPHLAARHGGPIAVRVDSEQRLIPTTAVFRATFTLDQGTLDLGTLDQGTPDQGQAAGTLAPTHELRGTLILPTSGRSLLGQALRTLLTIMIRESGLS